VLYQQFLDDSRKAEGESHFLRNSGRYPLCGRGDINVYTIFAEGMRNLLNDRGRVGCVLPTGIATDDTTKFFFQDVVEKKSLASLFDFENKGIFPGVHSSYKFCLFTSGRGVRPTAEAAEFVFFARTASKTCAIPSGASRSQLRILHDSIPIPTPAQFSALLVIPSWRRAPIGARPFS